MHRKVLTSLGLCAMASLSLQAQINNLFINEVRIDEPGADLNEFAELIGPPGFALDNVWYIILGDHSGEGNFQGFRDCGICHNLTGFTIWRRWL
ncbi:MAG: hypothetical protein LR015_01900, partial [Verrucomicrobia bacterium]|nr:hypothetical protein [Verrucomicrobiota bacterium]